jgi:hypothetical protein
MTVYIKPEAKSYKGKLLTEEIGVCQTQYQTIVLSDVNLGHGTIRSHDDTFILSRPEPAVGDDSENWSLRGFIGFDINSLHNKTIVSATLRIFEIGKSGLPSSLGSLGIDHVDFGQTLSANHATFYGNLHSGSIGTIPSLTIEEWKELDVTQHVTEDLSAGRHKSEYRLSFANPTNNNNIEDSVGFGNASGPVSSPAELAIVYHE